MKITETGSKYEFGPIRFGPKVTRETVIEPRAFGPPVRSTKVIKRKKKKK